MSRYVECPSCSEEALATARKCSRCGERLVAGFRMPPRLRVSLLVFVLANVLAGAVAVWYYASLCRSLELAAELHAAGDREESIRQYKRGYAVASDRKPTVLGLIVEEEAA